MAAASTALPSGGLMKWNFDGQGTRIIASDAPFDLRVTIGNCPLEYLSAMTKFDASAILDDDRIAIANWVNQAWIDIHSVAPPAVNKTRVRNVLVKLATSSATSSYFHDKVEAIMQTHGDPAVAAKEITTFRQSLVRDIWGMITYPNGDPTGTVPQMAAGSTQSQVAQQVAQQISQQMAQLGLGAAPAGGRAATTLPQAPSADPRMPKKSLASCSFMGNISKLTRANWESFTQQLCAALESKMPDGGYPVWGILDGSVEPMIGNTANIDYSATLDVQLGAVLLGTVSDTTRAHYIGPGATGMGLTNARNLGSVLFCLLKDGIRPNTKQERSLAMTQLMHLKQDARDKVKDYILNFRTLHGALLSRGGTIDDKTLVNTFRVGLNPAFGLVLSRTMTTQRDQHNALEMRDKRNNPQYVIQEWPGMTLDECYTALLQYEQDNFALRKTQKTVETGATSLVVRSDDRAMAVLPAAPVTLDDMASWSEENVLAAVRDTRRRNAGKQRDAHSSPGKKTRDSPPHMGGPSPRRQQGSPGSRPAFTRRRAARNPDDECNYCGRKGHWARECPKAASDRESGRLNAGHYAYAADLEEADYFAEPQALIAAVSSGNDDADDGNDSSNEVESLTCFNESINSAMQDDVRECIMLLQRQLAIDNKSQPLLWLLDSGATSHCCSDPKLLTAVRKIEGAYSTVANGGRMAITHIGFANVTIYGDDDDHGIRLQLRDVQVSPQVGLNLISLHRLYKDAGLQTTITHTATLRLLVPDDCRPVINSLDFDGRLSMLRVQLMSKVRNGKLVDLPASRPQLSAAMIKGVTIRKGTAPDICAVRDEASFDLSYRLAMTWHEKLGHASLAKMVVLAERKLIPLSVVDLKAILRANALECAACQEANIIVAPYPTSTSTSTAPLQLVAADLIGPIKGPEVNQQFFVLTMVDDFSRKAWLFIIANKTSKLILETLKLFVVENATVSHKLAAIRTDNGGEF
jgi:hypothetical protein